MPEKWIACWRLQKRQSERDWRKAGIFSIEGLVLRPGGVTVVRFCHSKGKFAKHIFEAMSGHCDLRKYGLYYEPFFGSGQMLAYFKKMVKKPELGVKDMHFYASDINSFLMAMHTGIVDGWRPPESVDQNIYDRCKSLALSEDAIYDPYYTPLTGYVGHCFSAYGKFFLSGCKGKMSGDPTRTSTDLKWIEEYERLFADVQFGCDVYWEDVFGIYGGVEPAIIYCDPPRPVNDPSIFNINFDEQAFWVWAEEMARKGRVVFVSATSAPLGWKILWQQKKEPRKLPDILPKNRALHWSNGKFRGIKRQYVRPYFVETLYALDA